MTTFVIKSDGTREVYSEEKIRASATRVGVPQPLQAAMLETIRERLELDDKIIEKAFSLHGIPKILLRNSLVSAICRHTHQTDSLHCDNGIEHILADQLLNSYFDMPIRLAPCRS